MYCSECGNLSNTGLNYCNRCGAQMPRKGSKNENLTGLSTALGYIGAFGVFAFMGIIIALTRSGVSGPIMVTIAVLYLAALLGICFMILRHMAGMKNEFEKRSVANVPPELRPLTTAQLYEGREPAASVTENTTRTLDEVAVSRK